MNDKETVQMNTAPYSAPEREDEWVDVEPPLALPSRPRRRLPGLATGLLFALLVGAIGFYVGIRVEKGQMSSSSVSAGTGTRGAAIAARGATGPGGGFARAFAGGAPGANGSVGTISAVNGKTLFLTDFTGNTVKVTVSGATTITKSVGVSAKSVHPGDTVVVSGLKGSGGTIAATSINDTGNRGGAGSGNSVGSGSTSASSAVSSLFGSANGG
jgi:hypothetical protein